MKGSKSSRGVAQVDWRHRTVHFRALIVDVDWVQILPGELPRLKGANPFKPTFQCSTITRAIRGINHTGAGEWIAHLCEVHQSGDARLVPIQSGKCLLPFRQDLIPATFTGHIHMRRGNGRQPRRTGFRLSSARVVGEGKEIAI